MKKLLLAIYILLNFSVLAQKKDSLKLKPTLKLVVPTENNFKPDVLPISPTAAAFQKYVEVPVNLNTGVPNVRFEIIFSWNNEIECRF